MQARREVFGKPAVMNDTILIMHYACFLHDGDEEPIKYESVISDMSQPQLRPMSTFYDDSFVMLVSRRRLLDEWLGLTRKDQLRKASATHRAISGEIVSDRLAVAGKVTKVEDLSPVRMPRPKKAWKKNARGAIRA